MSKYIFSSRLGLRYALPHRGAGLTGFLSFVSLAGLAVAVFTLIVVMSVMNGFEKELQNRMLSLIPHAQLHWHNQSGDWRKISEQLRGQPHIEGVAPYVEDTVMLQSNGNLANARIIGVDNQLEAQVSSLSDALVAGDMQRLGDQPFSLIIGRQLAERFGVTVGDYLNITVPRVYITPFGAKTRQKRFIVAAVFEVGAELDHSLVISDIASVNTLFKRSTAIDGLRIAVTDQYKSQTIAGNAIASLINAGLLDSDSQWRDWREQHQVLYRAVVMEKIMIFVLLLAVVAIASFNVISILLMTVTDKRKDIAVLKTMGATQQQIKKLFIVQGTLTGTLGAGLGALLGVLVANDIGNLLSLIESISGWQLFDPDVYYIPFLPSDLRAGDVLIVSVCAIVISMLVTIAPAARAAKIDPVLSIRATQ